MKAVIIVFFSVVCCISECYAQSFAVKSNEDFGEGILYLDSHPYPMTPLEKERLRVVYEGSFSFQQDTTRKLKTRCVLQIGSGKTKFVGEIRHRYDSVLSRGGTIYQAGRLFNGKANPVFAQDCLITDMNGGWITFTGRLAADDFLYEEPLIPVNWEIQQSFRKICGYRCQLATGVFRGRQYQVWFASEIPSSAGPWKLNGLPGVILSVEDTDHVISFEAIRILPGNGEIMWTEYPYIKVARKDYEKMLNQFFKDPVLFVSSHLSRSGWRTELKEDRIPQTYSRPVILERQ